MAVLSTYLLVVGDRPIVVRALVNEAFLALWMTSLVAAGLVALFVQAIVTLG